MSEAPAALCIVAVISRFDEAIQWARQQVQEHWGCPLLESPPFSFDQTEYYTESMGSGLKKPFLVPLTRFDPSRLAEVKHRCRSWEEQLRGDSDFGVARPLNLDPGYLTADKLVLASTKNHAHRIYLHSGIFAELTLQYRHSRWQPLPWTYPDYRTAEYHSFFSLCRQYLRDQVKREAAKP